LNMTLTSKKNIKTPDRSCISKLKAVKNNPWQHSNNMV
jgi:hypothetical protein